MSKTKWVLAVVPLLLAAAPAALADEAGDAQGQEVVAPACADDQQQAADAQRVQDLEAQVEALRAQLAARSSDDVPQYLDQNDPLSP